MELKERLFRALLKRGHSLREEKRVWDIAERTFLYLTPELDKGFLNLINHERYKEIVVNKEIELLKENAKKILAEVGTKSFNLIDIGCSDGTKARELLSALGKDVKICFCPVNISQPLVDLTLQKMKEANLSNILKYKPFLKEFENLGEIISLMREEGCEKNVILLLDSMLASYEINDYLYQLSEAMLPGDYLLIGNGIREGKRFSNLKNYRSPLFDNWFFNLMTTLGIKKDEVEYDARFENGRVEMFYRFNVDKTIESSGKSIIFRKDDEIIVAVLYKYYADELEEFCKMYFSEVKLVKDKEEEYALVLCKK